MSALPEAPTSLPAFQRMFGSEDACREYLFRVRWPGGFVCPKDGMWHLAPSDELRRWIEDHRPEIHRVTKEALERP